MGASTFHRKQVAACDVTLSITKSIGSFPYVPHFLNGFRNENDRSAVPSRRSKFSVASDQRCRKAFGKSYKGRVIGGHGVSQSPDPVQKYIVWVACNRNIEKVRDGLYVFPIQRTSKTRVPCPWRTVESVHSGLAPGASMGVPVATVVHRPVRAGALRGR